ncbi:hypothetical protein [Polaribacter sp. R77954]|uniref:hypothetical protein n=1 Tax=Polaribacter sp. R77954 TaxID=3093870 RepID=UPI0037C785D9
MDSGNKLTKPLNFIRKILELYGFYSPFSRGKVVQWTHPKTLDCLNVRENKFILNQQNLNGACVSANYNNIKVRNLIRDWSNCAKLKKCIAPKGSNRGNHRQDQAVLSVLVYRDIPKIGKRMFYDKFGFKTHQDID